ncbi:MAG: hypothetical protein WD770_03305 [Actinomycetota bacterium]
MRDQIRRIGFYISDYSGDSSGFTAADFDGLVASGQVEVEGGPERPTTIDLSILREPEREPEDEESDREGLAESQSLRRAHEPNAQPRDSTARSFTLTWLRDRGFEGFIPFRDLIERILDVPPDAGIYVVVHGFSSAPEFLPESVGGHFKGRNPTVPVDALAAKWVEHAETVYIGKANQLRRRLREYALYGQGRPIGHQGGRYIWQLPTSAELLVGWKATPDNDPRQAELDLLAEFVDEFGLPPFANLAK